MNRESSIPRAILYAAFAAAFCGLVPLRTVAAGSDSPQPPRRVVIPVRQRVLGGSGGVIRYSIPISIGGTRLEVMLDTGSTGLRVLPGAVPPGDFVATARSTAGSFGSGAQFKGVIANATIEVGGLRSADPVPFEAIQTVGCDSKKPHCGASHIAPQDFRIGGGGSGQGFKAIVGISLQPHYTMPNLLLALGAHAWIIVLPKPGGSRPGELILNPDPADRAGFTTFPLAKAPGAYDAIPGCLTIMASRGQRSARNGGRRRSGRAMNTGEQVCAPATLDTGAPGVNIMQPSGGRRSRFQVGESARLSFGNGPAALPPLTFTVAANGAAHVGVLPTAKAGQSKTIHAGTLPYFTYAVLFDNANGLMGLKPRGNGAL